MNVVFGCVFKVNGTMLTTRQLNVQWPQRADLSRREKKAETELIRMTAIAYQLRSHENAHRKFVSILCSPTLKRTPFHTSVMAAHNKRVSEQRIDVVGLSTTQIGQSFLLMFHVGR